MRAARLGCLLSAVVLAAGPAWAPSARAQVTVNPGALDLLPGKPTKPEPRRQERERPERSTSERKHPERNRSTKPPAPTPPAAAKAPEAPPPPQVAKPALPTVPPAIAALPPPPPLPAPRGEAPAVAPVAADAPGTASPMPGGVRVTFGPGRQELNPVTETALRDLARRYAGDQGSISINAYASGAAEDPSTARRLSLGRALAARAVLINEGIASNRIYPKALGAAGGDGGADRVDVVADPSAGRGADRSQAAPAAAR